MRASRSSTTRPRTSPPTCACRTDLLNTRGLYYVIPKFGTPQFNDPNFTDQPINLNNSGIDDRKIYDAALKLNYNTGGGTLTSITGYSTVWEILTGDGLRLRSVRRVQADFRRSISTRASSSASAP